MQRARGFIDMAFDLVAETTNLVERTHDSVVKRSTRRFPAAKGVANIHTAVSGGVFASIRLINGFTRFAAHTATDVAEAGLRRSPNLTGGRYVDQLQASVNGFWGDYLSRRGNDLDLGMTIPEPISNPTKKICVFVHGLAMTELIWSQSAERHYGNPDVTFGTRLRDDLDFTPIYVRYNSGRHISENGQALAALLTEVLNAYPVPVDQIALVGHSMGGLVARSAAHYAREQDEPWVARLRHVACLGSPNLGAPLEQAVNVVAGALNNIDAAGAQVPAELLNSRSAGIKDLRHGYTVDEEWTGKDPDAVFADARRNVPLVDGVGYYFLAATVARDPEHPLGRLVGDFLVRLPSASGQASEVARKVHFSGGAVFPGMNHLHLANHPDVYETLRDLLDGNGGSR